jgi:hypothetical protein
MMVVVRAKARAAGRAKGKAMRRDRVVAKVLAVGRARVVAAPVGVRAKVAADRAAMNRVVGASVPGAVRA